MPQSQSATPSGVLQNEPQFVVVPRLPNSVSYTEEGNLLEPRRTSHNLAHSTGLPKPPGYNFEWPRVTPIQVTLIIGPPTKHCLMTSIQSGVGILLTSNSAPITAWQTPHAARRHTLFRASTRSFPPSGIIFSAKRHAFQAYLVFPYHLTAHLKPLGATLVASLVLVFGALKQVPKNPKHYTYNP